MTLQERILGAIKEAMKAKNAERLGTLRLIKSAFDYALLETKADALTDPEVVSILQKEAKKRGDSIDQFEKGGRPELAEKERRELSVIQEFLPRPLSSEELEALVQETISEAGATSRKEMGQVIKAVQAKAAGRADGKTISSLVARLLG